MKENVGRILLFGSTDDPFLPWSEQNEVSLSVYNKFQWQSSLHVQGLNAKYMTSTITTNLGAELNNYEDRTLKINKQTNGRKRWKITIKTLKGGHKLGRRVAQVWGQGALHGLQVSRTDQGCNRHCQISKVIKWWFYKCSTSLCKVYLIGSNWIFINL